MVILIVAFDDNRVIGYRGKLPWHLPEDLKKFKETTTGHTVLMGRKTYDSLPDGYRPLPGRLNLVITRDTKLQSVTDRPEGPHYLPDIVSACTVAKGKGEDIYIIGGAKVYELALKLGLVDKIIATRVKGTHVGDCHFPLLPEDRWAMKSLEKHDEFEIVEYSRIRKDVQQSGQKAS